MDDTLSERCSQEFDVWGKPNVFQKYMVDRPGVRVLVERYIRSE